MSPSGKALGSGPSIRGFDPLHPSHEVIGKTTVYSVVFCFKKASFTVCSECCLNIGRRYDCVRLGGMIRLHDEGEGDMLYSCIFNFS